MRVRGWLVGAMLMFSPLAAAQAQTVKAADFHGGWLVKAGYDDGKESDAYLLFWPDGLWYFNYLNTGHGGARWRLVGDTLWLANDFYPYYNSMIGPRIEALRAKGYGDLATMDMDIIGTRMPFAVPDSVYWSKAFRDSTRTCANTIPCETWVYKVSKRGQQILLARIDNLTRIPQDFAAKMEFIRRDSLTTCTVHNGGCGNVKGVSWWSERMQALVPMQQKLMRRRSGKP